MLLVAVALGAALAGAAGWGALRLVKVAATTSAEGEVPITRVKRGRVVVAVTASGELQGGNSEMLAAPTVGGGDLPITFLREPGEVVQAGDVVVQFDTTQQEYNLREAEADLAEAEQQVAQAQADAEATAEETRYAVLSAESDVRQAELDVRKNPILPAIVRQENDLALEAAQARLKQAQQDLKNKSANAAAAIAIQQAARNKAKVMAELAQKNIDSMTLHAKTSGYVNIQQNTNINMLYWGMQLPAFQVGDAARTGMAVAQIPDLKSWEISANVGELDRGHISPGQKVTVRVVALAGKGFEGKVKSLGGTTGAPWDRHFECRIALDRGSPELRPGMTSNLVITAEILNDVLWLPFEALFEGDGRTFVYRKERGGFMPHDVTLVRRSESRAVVAGLHEGDVVALSNPDQSAAGGRSAASGAMKALGK